MPVFRPGLLALVCLSPAVARGQGTPFQEGWRWARFLSSAPTAVHLIAEDAAGHVWAGTATDVRWFDGFRWQTPPRGLPVGEPALLLPAARRGVVTVIGGRLYQGDTAGFERIPVRRGDVDLVVAGVAVMPGGDLLLAGRQDSSWGLYRVHERTPRPFAPPAPLDSGSTRRVWQTGDGQIWLNTTAGLYRLRGGDWESVLPARRTLLIAALTQGPDGGLLSITLPASHAGLWEWEPDGPLRHRESEGRNAAAALAVGPHGDAVAVYETGHVRVRRNGSWSTLAPAPPEFHGALTVRFRPSGDLWVGSRSGLALYRRSLRRWAGHARPFPDARNRINAILVARDGALYVGTSDGLEIHRADTSYVWVSTIAGRRVGPVTGLAEDPAGDIWVTSGSGFPGAYRWDHRTWRHIGVADGLRLQYVHRVAPDRSGRLWFLGLPGAGAGGGPEPGVAVLEDGRIRSWAPDTALPSKRVYAFAEGPDGTRWFGTGAGLSRWRDGAWTHWGSAAGLGVGVFTLAVDSSGRVWFGDRRSGLGTVDPEDRVRFLTTADGLMDNAVWDLTVDRRGWLWIATHGGLCSYRDGMWSHFDEDVGLANPSLWPVMTVADSVFVGTQGQGLIVLRRTEDSSPPPLVGIDPVVADQGAVFARWRVFPWWGQAPAEHFETRSRVDGGPWSPWSTARERVLRNVGFGRHVLEVQAKGLFGRVDGSPPRASFSVPAPIYLRPVVALPLALLSSALAGLGVAVVHRKRRHDRALRDSEARFRQLSQAAFEGIAVVADGRIRDANARLAEFLGYETGDLVGLPFWETVAPEARETVMDRLAQASGDPFEYAARRRDGASRTVEARVTPMSYREQAARAVVVRDVSQRKYLEAQLVQAQKMEGIGRLAGGVAHDFNNLLTAILGYADLIDRSLAAGDPRREDVNELRRAAQRAGNLTRQLLAFARRQRAEPRVLALNEVVRGTEQMLRRVLGEDVELVTVLDPVVRAVRIDPGQLEQVIVNLAVNARDAMPHGGRLTIATGTIDVPPGRFPEVPAGPYAALRVTDTGTGMSREVLARLFEPFFTTKEVGRGTGLGLATCYGIVRQAGGHIAADSEPDRGATFTVFLPETAVPEPAPAPDPGPPEVLPRGDETILLVEDEPQLRDLATRTLRQQGYQIVVAPHADEALAAVARMEQPPHLLLTDVVLPGMNGQELAGRIRRWFPGVRVLFVSGYTDRLPTPGGRLDGGAFLAKPFTPSALARAVRRALDEPA